MKVSINVGDVFTVAWSNGHGESVYRVTDSVYGSSHNFELVSENEFGDGDDDGMTDDDFEAVFADIVARRGVAE
jgi:hypothetical protein